MKRSLASNKKAVSVTPVNKAINVEALYLTHHHRVLHFVKRYVRNAQDAEDVTQNTFIEAIRCAGSFSGASKPSTWLFGIALNLARNQIRRNCADKFDDIDQSLFEALVDDTADPVQLCALREVACKTQQLLDQLSPEILRTFHAVVEDDTSYEETAQEMNIPIGTVRSRISRVRTFLRTEFNA